MSDPFSDAASARSAAARESSALQRAAIRLATPFIAGNLLQSFVFFVDALMLARVGEAELAAVSITGILLWRSTEIVGCLQIGVAAFVSRRWGEELYGRARRAASHGISLAFLLGLAAALALLPQLKPILRALGAEPDVAGAGAAYAAAVICAFPLNQVLINLAASMRAAGDSRTPFLASIITNITNIVFNYLLIFGHFGFPRLGMLGAGIATAIAITLGAFSLLTAAAVGVRPRRLFAAQRPACPKEVSVEPEQDLPLALPLEGLPGQTEPIPLGPPLPENGEAEREAPAPLPAAAFAPASPPRMRGATPRDADPVFRLTRHGFRLRIPVVTGRILRISAPALLEEALISIGFFAFIRLIAGFGTTALAAHSAVVRIESLSFMIGAGFSVAASTMVGQSLGRRDPRSAVLAFAWCAWFSAVSMATLGIIYALIPEALLSWFSREKDFLSIAIPLLIIVSIEQPLIGAAATLSGGLRGAGDTLSPSLAQLFGNILIRVGGGYFLSVRLGMGVQGVYWATVADWGMRFVVLFSLVLRGRWRRTLV